MSEHPRQIEARLTRERIARENAKKMPTYLAQTNGGVKAKNGQNNPFPADCFPGKIENAINATNATLGYPKDFSGASILVNSSAAIGNTILVELRKGFRQTATIYAAQVGRPGTAKTPATYFWMAPLIEKDKEHYKQYKKDVEQYDQLSSLSNKELEAQGLPKPVKPELIKTIASDFTTEALVYVHNHNPRGLLVYSDELAGFFKNLNRYNNGSDQEFWLSNFSNKPIITDRKGSAPIFIQHPFISVLGSIQPAILDEMGKGGRNQNGFIDRFLFAWPDDLKVNQWSEMELDETVLADYSLILRNILDQKLNTDYDGNICPKVIRFSAEAYKVIKEWQKNNADLSNQEDRQEFSGVYSKLELYTIRLSLILQTLYWAACEDDLQVINKRAVESSIKLIEYFRINAEKVFNTINNGTPTDNLPLTQKQLYESLPQIFTTAEGVAIADIFNIPKRTFNRMLGKDKGLFTKIKQGHYEKNY